MTIKISANDPINKIDPAGTTPQNTVLPPRYENEPQAVKWAGSNRTAFCLPNDPNYMENEAYHTFTIWDWVGPLNLDNL